jgi:hypothetical protein
MEMTLTQDLVLESMKVLPPKFSLDALVERLIFMEKVREGLQQAKDGDVISHENLIELSKTWGK